VAVLDEKKYFCPTGKHVRVRAAMKI